MSKASKAARSSVIKLMAVAQTMFPNSGAGIIRKQWVTAAIHAAYESARKHDAKFMPDWLEELLEGEASETIVSELIESIWMNIKLG